MPRLVDPITRTDDVILAVIAVIATDGITALTMRRIADQIRLSPSALHIHYGSRARMLSVIGIHTGLARRRRIEARAWSEGALAFLPRDDDDLVAARAWLGWCELGRSSDRLATMMATAVRDELALLARAVDHRLARPELEVLTAVIDGLVVALCRRERPMSRERAREILRETLAHLDPAEHREVSDPRAG